LVAFYLSFQCFKWNPLAIFPLQSKNRAKINQLLTEATASSIQSPTGKYGPKFAVDNKGKTLFLSRDEPYQWIEIDIKEEAFVQFIAVQQPGERETLTRYVARPL